MFLAIVGTTPNTRKLHEKINLMGGPSKAMLESLNEIPSLLLADELDQLFTGGSSPRVLNYNLREGGQAYYHSLRGLLPNSANPKMTIVILPYGMVAPFVEEFTREMGIPVILGRNNGVLIDGKCRTVMYL